jgi:hypothetical protein
MCSASVVSVLGIKTTLGAILEGLWRRGWVLLRRLKNTQKKTFLLRSPGVSKYEQVTYFRI